MRRFPASYPAACGLAACGLAVFVVVACHPGSSPRAPAPVPDPEPVTGYRAPPAGEDISTTGLGALGPRVAAALHAPYRDPARSVPLVSLTPTDGSELALRQLTADIRIRGPLAHTELHLAFHNAEARAREGRFAVELPPAAAVSRFAMKIDGSWREARAVSRGQGRAVYESYLHRRIDPGLLERDADNRFSARVFPIAAAEDKEIILGYDQVVGPGAPYELPLHNLPAVPLEVSIDRDGKAERRTSEGPPADIVLDAAPGSVALAGGAAFVARIDEAAAPAPAALDRVFVLVDTSASRVQLLRTEAEVVLQLVASLPAGAEVEVAAFDHAVEPLYRGRAGDVAGVVDAVLEHGALGASNLGGALAYAAASGLSRVVLVGDAVATLGERDLAKLAAIVSGSQTGHPIERLDVLRIGQAIDPVAARALVAAGRLPGAILDAHDLDRIAQQLAASPPPVRTISVPGAIASWPATTAGAAPGDPLFVYGLYGGAVPDALTVAIGDRKVGLAAVHGEPAAVRRVVAGAELTALGTALALAPATDADTTQQLRAEIEHVALAHGLVSSQTSLIVLESDLDERVMLGARDGAPLPEPPTWAPSLTDEELAKLAEQEAKSEVILITGGGFDQGFSDGYGGAPYTGPPTRGEASPGVPSIDRSRQQQHAAGMDDPEPEPAPVRPPPVAAAPPPPRYPAPYTGALNAAMIALRDHLADQALDIALRARFDAPSDVAAIIALGEVLEARGASALATRAYGSLIDLFPSRDDLLRVAGERLDRIGGPALELAVDAYRRAIAERPERAVGYRRLGYALARLGRWRAALDALADGLPRTTRNSASQILREDIGLVGAAAIAADPAGAPEIRAQLDRLAISVPDAPSLRFVLQWETDANDVDLHVRDGSGNEADYQHRTLASGGALLDDVTDGFGPEMLSIALPSAFPYRAFAHYYARGPEGLGLGTLQVIKYDGHGGLAIDDRPFVIQVDHAMIDLGTVAQ
jgi:tetratricopeptide (TPR) repeat protein